jgi:allantoate deiminase
MTDLATRPADRNTTTRSLGARLQAMLAEAAAISEPGPGVTRLPFTPEHARALDLIRGWMAAAGLTPTLDAAGTLVGRGGGEGPS